LVAGQELNLRPLSHEPDELPGFSTDLVEKSNGGARVAASAIDCENKSDTARCVLPIAELVTARAQSPQLKLAALERLRGAMREATRERRLARKRALSSRDSLIQLPLSRSRSWPVDAIACVSTKVRISSRMVRGTRTMGPAGESGASRKLQTGCASVRSELGTFDGFPLRHSHSVANAKGRLFGMEFHRILVPQGDHEFS